MFHRAVRIASLVVVSLTALAALGCGPKYPTPAPDTDHDGVPDAVDRCPGQKEDGLDPEPRDGCPKG